MATPLKFAVVALALGLSMPSFAEESHHPSASPAQTAPTPQAAPGVPSPMRPGMGPGGMSMGGQGGMMGPGGMMGGPVMSMMHGSERIEGRLAFIKAELKITEAQEKLWADLAGTLREAAAKMQQAHRGMQAMSGSPATMTPPQLLEQHERNLALRLEATRTVKAALGPLYAALDEQQKQTLAQLHPMFHGMM
jgi:hypothetical protein